MLNKIYEKLDLIIKELQAIRRSMESKEKLVINGSDLKKEQSKMKYKFPND